MKKLVVVILMFSSWFASAQTAGEIVEKYAAAMGGLDVFKNTVSAKITGTIKSQGNDLPFTLQILNGKSMRMDISAMGQAVVNVYHNNSGWKINPFANAPTATDVTGSELIAFKAQASIANNLMDYKGRGHTIELLGTEDVEGVATHKIKLTAKEDGKLTTYYISVKDNLLVKSVTKREIAGTEYDTETFYSDMKEISGSNGSLKFSMHFVQKIMGQVFQEVSYEKVELNVPVDPAVFNQ